jgi:hypothetical protein
MITKYALLMGFVTGVAILFFQPGITKYISHKTASMFMILVLEYHSILS